MHVSLVHAYKCSKRFVSFLMATLLYNLDVSVLAVNCICSYTGGTDIPFNCFIYKGEGDNIKAVLCCESVSVNAQSRFRFDTQGRKRLKNYERGKRKEE